MNQKATSSTEGAPEEGTFRDDAVYTVSVAAELAGMHAQTLRQYDRLGLVSPKRTLGRGRRYSSADIQLLREIQSLSQEQGLNLAGIQLVLALRSQIRTMRAEIQELNRVLQAAAAPTHRVFAADSAGRVRLRAERGNVQQRPQSEKPGASTPSAPLRQIQAQPTNLSHSRAIVPAITLTGWQRLLTLQLQRRYRERIEAQPTAGKAPGRPGVSAL